jgi:hypothetical protein
MRACLETQKLERLEERMEKIIDRVPHARISTDEARLYDERCSGTDEAQRYPN